MPGRLIPAGLLVLATAFAALPERAHGQASLRASEEVELTQLERDWDRAFLQNDTDFIDRVLAREFMALYPDGSKGDRAKELANAATFNQKIDSSTLDDFTIRRTWCGLLYLRLIEEDMVASARRLVEINVKQLRPSENT